VLLPLIQRHARREEGEWETDGEKYDDDGDGIGLPFIGSARRLPLISTIAHH